MKLTVTLHCNGQQDHGCTNTLTVGYYEAGHWGISLIAHARATGWTVITPAGVASGQPSEAFCGPCATRRQTGDYRYESLIDLLSLVCVTVTVSEVAAWSPTMRIQAEEWAALEHLSASDNPVARKRKPGFLP